jgi:small subunit ribosomal protein S1
MSEPNVPEANPAVPAGPAAAVVSAVRVLEARPVARVKVELGAETEREIEAAMAELEAENQVEIESSVRSRIAPPPPPNSTPGLKRGRVLLVRNEYIFIDLGGKTQGALPREQFDEPPAVGSLVDVLIDRYDSREGVLVLRLPTAAQSFDWDSLHEGMVIDVRATASNKGGLEVNVGGVRGFVPASQIDLYRVADMNEYVGQTIRCLVTEVNRAERNVLLSRRAVLEKEREEAQKRLWAELAEGQVRTGTVRNVKEFGAFVDLGGVDGLVPIREMSWTRVDQVEDVLRVGQQVQVKVLKIDHETRKLTLGLKQLQASPWDTVMTKYPVGVDVPARVTRLMDFGAFAELEPGVEGLIHVSELSLQRVRRVRDVVQEGQQLMVRVQKVDAESKRIALSMKAIAAAAQKAAEESAALEAEPAEGEPQPIAKPERKVPLRGGLGR